MQKIYSAIWMVISLLVGSVSYADWQSSYYLDHPLVGKIYSLAEESFVTEDEVSAAFATTPFLLLGEKHTNKDHHIGQAKLIQQWHQQKGKTALVLEMLEVDAWPYAEQIWQDGDQLAEKLSAVASRWDWAIYQPIIQTAVAEQLPLFAANLSRAVLSEYADGTQCQLEREEKSTQICDTINQAEYAAINELIYDAHCGYVPRDQLNSLVNIQIAKDASFALSMINASEQHNVVLITGAVHARKDFGVPAHLKKLGSDSLSVVFLVVDPSKKTPQEYWDESLGQQYDFVFFTPSENDIDPCDEFAEQLKRMNKHK